MEIIPTNAAIFSPRGFRPRVPDPRTVVEVPAGSVWGSDDVRRLRTAGLVRVTPPAPPEPAGEPRSGGDASPGRMLGADDLTVRTVVWLTMSGVPVSGPPLPASVRDRLDPTLLDLLDRVTPDAVADPGARELLSLGLRRRTREVQARRRGSTSRPVLVLLPEAADTPPTLLADLAAQTWPAVPLHEPPGGATADDVLTQAREVGAPWCTRVRADVRYGPHHLADLVDALAHSGAAVAHSPLRFRPWPDGSWLEDDRLGVEGPARTGLEAGSLWYAADGPVPPSGVDGYAVHGANAVPAEPVEGSEAVALRLSGRRPAVLDWLVPDEDEGRPPAGGPGGPLPPSYFAGAPSRARSATTASEI